MSRTIAVAEARGFPFFDPSRGTSREQEVRYSEGGSGERGEPPCPATEAAFRPESAARSFKLHDLISRSDLAYAIAEAPQTQDEQ